MFGSLISMKWIGKKSWKDAGIFWIVYLVSVIIVGGILSGFLVPNMPTITDDMTQDEIIEAMKPYQTEMAIYGSISIVITVGIFLALAHYWYKFNWFDSLKIFAVGYVLDIVIAVVLFGLLFVFLFGLLVNLPGAQFYYLLPS